VRSRNRPIQPSLPSTDLTISLRDIEHTFTKAIHYADEPALQGGNALAAAFRQQVAALDTLTEDAAGEELAATFGVYPDTVDTVVTAILNGDEFDEAKIGAVDRLAAELRERLASFRQIQVDRFTVQGLNQTLDAIVAPLQEATEVVERLAKRDLTRDIVGEYPGDYGRISVAVNRAVDNTAGALETLRQASDDVLQSSHEIAAGNQDLATRTERQAFSLEEVAHTMGSMSTTAHLSAKGAGRARDLATDAQAVADRGAAVVSEAIAAIAAIDESSDRISPRSST